MEPVCPPSFHQVLLLETFACSPLTPPLAEDAGLEEEGLMSSLMDEQVLEGGEKKKGGREGVPTGGGRGGEEVGAAEEGGE